MGLFSGNKNGGSNKGGFLNRIANPNPNGKGFLDFLTAPIKDKNGGLFDRLMGRKPASSQPTPSQPTSTPAPVDPTQNNTPGGSSW